MRLSEKYMFMEKYAMRRFYYKPILFLASEHLHGLKKNPQRIKSSVQYIGPLQDSRDLLLLGCCLSPFFSQKIMIKIGNWGIPRQIDQTNLEITPYISDFDETRSRGFSWALILAVPFLASFFQRFFSYCLRKFFDIVKNTFF